ncbi:hypothetical protein [Actinomadura luteofluorescens]|uniref:hypothetical protein n=1 Tax=Actinomadura luteofluorescens TaxID=46163 RepID=UPI003D8D3847
MTAPGENPFAALGVTATQQNLYLTLLYNPGSTLGELAGMSEAPRPRLAALLLEMEDLGMISAEGAAGVAGAGGAAAPADRAYTAHPPDAVVETLIRKRETEFIRARIEAKRINGDLLAAEQRSNPEKLVAAPSTRPRPARRRCSTFSSRSSTPAGSRRRRCASTTSPARSTSGPGCPRPTGICSPSSPPG